MFTDVVLHRSSVTSVLIVSRADLQVQTQFSVNVAQYCGSGRRRMGVGERAFTGHMGKGKWGCQGTG